MKPEIGQIWESTYLDTASKRYMIIGRKFPGKDTSYPKDSDGFVGWEAVFLEEGDNQKVWWSNKCFEDGTLRLETQGKIIPHSNQIWFNKEFDRTVVLLRKKMTSELPSIHHYPIEKDGSVGWTCVDLDKDPNHRLNRPIWYKNECFRNNYLTFLRWEDSPLNKDIVQPIKRRTRLGLIRKYG